jgi:hypothetical protein
MLPRIQTHYDEPRVTLVHLDSIPEENEPGSFPATWDSLCIADHPLEELLLAWVNRYISEIPRIQDLNKSEFLSQVTFLDIPIFLGPMKGDPLTARDVARGRFFTPRAFNEKMQGLTALECIYACGGSLDLNGYYLTALSQIPEFPCKLLERIVKKQKEKQILHKDLPDDASQDLDLAYVLRLQDVNKKTIDDLSALILSFFSDLTGYYLNPEEIKVACLRNYLSFQDCSKIVISVGRGYGKLSDGQPDHSFDCTFYCVQAGAPSPARSSIFYSNSGTVTLTEQADPERSINELIDSLADIIRPSGPLNKGTLSRLIYDLCLGKYLPDLQLPRRALAYVLSPAAYLDGILKHKKILSSYGLYSAIINTYTLVFPCLCTEEKELWTRELMPALTRLRKIDPNCQFLGDHLEGVPENAECLSLVSTLELVLENPQHLKYRNDRDKHWVARQLSPSYSVFLPVKMDYLLSDKYLSTNIDLWVQFYVKISKADERCFSKLEELGITRESLLETENRYQERKTSTSALMSLIYLAILSKKYPKERLLTDALLRLPYVLPGQRLGSREPILKATRALFPQIGPLQKASKENRKILSKRENLVEAIFTTLLPQTSMRETLFQLFQKMASTGLLNREQRGGFANRFFHYFLGRSTISRAILHFDEESKCSSWSEITVRGNSCRLITCIRDASQKTKGFVDSNKFILEFLKRECEKWNVRILDSESKEELELLLLLHRFLKRKLPAVLDGKSTTLKPYFAVLRAGPEACVEPLVELVASEPSSTCRSFLNLLPFDSPILKSFLASWGEDDSPLFLLLDLLLTSEETRRYEHVHWALSSVKIASAVSQKQKNHLKQGLCFPLLDTSATCAVALCQECVEDTKMMGEHPPFHLALCVQLLERKREGTLDLGTSLYMACVHGLLQLLPAENKLWRSKGGVISSMTLSEEQTWPIDAFAEKRERLLKYLLHDLTDAEHRVERKGLYALLRASGATFEEQALLLFEELNTSCEDAEAYDLAVLACRMLSPESANIIDDNKAVLQSLCADREDLTALEKLMKALGKEQVFKEICSEKRLQGMVKSLAEKDVRSAMKHAVAIDCQCLSEGARRDSAAYFVEVFAHCLESLKSSRDKKGEMFEIFQLLKKQSSFMPRDAYFSHFLNQVLSNKLPKLFLSIAQKERVLLLEHCPDLDVLTDRAILQITPLTDSRCKEYLEPYLHCDEDRFISLLELFREHQDYDSLRTALFYFERFGLHPRTSSIYLELLRVNENPEKDLILFLEKGYLKDVPDSDIKPLLDLCLHNERDRKSGPRVIQVAALYALSFKTLGESFHSQVEKGFQTDMTKALQGQSQGQLESSFSISQELFPDSAATSKRWLDQLEQYYEKDDTKRMEQVPFLLRFLPRIAPLLRNPMHTEQLTNALHRLWVRVLILAEGAEFNDKTMASWFVFLDTFENEIDQSELFSWQALLDNAEEGFVGLPLIAASLQSAHEILMKKPANLAQLWIQLLQKTRRVQQGALASTLTSFVQKKTLASALLIAPSLDSGLRNRLLRSIVQTMLEEGQAHVEDLLCLHRRLETVEVVYDENKLYASLSLVRVLAGRKERTEDARNLFNQLKGPYHQAFSQTSLSERVNRLACYLWMSTEARKLEAELRALFVDCHNLLVIRKRRKVSRTWKKVFLTTLPALAVGAVGAYSFRSHFSSEINGRFPSFPQSVEEFTRYYSQCNTPTLGCPRLAFDEDVFFKNMITDSQDYIAVEALPSDGRVIIASPKVYLAMKASRQFRVDLPEPNPLDMDAFVNSGLRSGGVLVRRILEQYFRNRAIFEKELVLERKMKAQNQHCIKRGP